MCVCVYTCIAFCLFLALQRQISTKTNLAERSSPSEVLSCAWLIWNNNSTERKKFWNISTFSVCWTYESYNFVPQLSGWAEIWMENCLNGKTYLCAKCVLSILIENLSPNLYFKLQFILDILTNRKTARKEEHIC